MCVCMCVCMYVYIHIYIYIYLSGPANTGGGLGLANTRSERTLEHAFANTPNCDTVEREHCEHCEHKMRTREHVFMRTRVREHS